MPNCYTKISVPAAFTSCSYYVDTGRSVGWYVTSVIDRKLEFYGKARCNIRYDSHARDSRTRWDEMKFNDVASAAEW